jgi:dynein heavy chain
MNSGRFLADLLEYAKDDIDQKIIDKLKPFVDMPKFNKADLMSVSPVVANIASWCLAMFKYYHVNLIVIPKKAALAKAQGEYNVVAATLKIK